MENSNNTKAEEGLKNHQNNVSMLNCIDLSSPDIHHSVSLLKQACLDSGFFYVINHGIDQEFMDEVFHQSKRFFDLPLSEKMKILRNEKHRGYSPVFDLHLDPVNQLHGDFKEGYYIGVEVPEDDPHARKPFYGANIWPSSGTLIGAQELSHFRILLCHNSFKVELLKLAYFPFLGVGKQIAKIIALSLNLEPDYFDRPEILGKNIANLRLLHYEGIISDPTKGVYGAGAHTDFGLMTLLATDEVYGLQICKDKDDIPQKWEFVAPLKGAFVVNLGDMLERWSNCTFRSTLHRVLGNGRERYSIAYFVEPNHDCLVECLPTCQSPENPAKFPPIRSETYMLQRYNETHADLSSYS